MKLWRLLPFLLPSVLIVACALPTDERATPYDRDELSPALANTTTTSTTTTTTTTTTLAPPDSSATTAATSTTTGPPSATAQVDLYYSVGFSDEMARLKRALPDDASVAQVIDQLESPLADVAELFRLRTWVRSGMVADVAVERGLATVSLDPEIVDDMSETNLRRAIAQLVLTLTSFSTDDRGAIGRVRFDVDGEGFEVFVPAFGGSSDPGEELAFEDFDDLIASTTATTTTTSTTPPTPSTEPETTAG